MTMQESRKFSVHPAVIFQVIYAQAGTLSKAVLECLMNSVDAEASEVSVDITTTGVSIKDNGRGFQTKEQIENWFEVFGFPHQEGDRVYGQFGMGRGQLWAFARTIWYTNEFVMDVDIKARGLDYTLSQSDKPFQGVHIEGEFYEPLLNVEVEAVKRELAEMAKYLQIPVKVNKKLINQSPKEEKWTHETDEAYILLKPSSREMAVYNLGVLVRKYHAHNFGGVGGLVITKPGVRLMLNMARNDVLVSQCPVWKKIKPYIVATAEKERPANKRMSAEELQSIGMAAVAGDCPDETLSQVKLVTLVNGKSETLGQFVEHCLATYGRGLLCSAPKSNKLGVKLHEAKMAYVLADETLERFGVSGAEEFADVVQEILARYEHQGYRPLTERYFYFSKDHSILKAQKLSKRTMSSGVTFKSMEAEHLVNMQARVLSVTDDFEFASRNLKTSHELIKPKSVVDKLNLQFAQRITGLARDVVSVQLNERLAYRTAFIGESEVAEAWTDGNGWVAYKSTMVKNLSKGFSQWLYMLNVAVHEFLHNASDLDSHIHDEVFMERYHECLLSRQYRKATDNLMGFYALFLAECEKKDIRRLKTALVGADKLGIDVDELAAQVVLAEQAEPSGVEEGPAPVVLQATSTVLPPGSSPVESTEEFFARIEATLQETKKALAG